MRIVFGVLSLLVVVAIVGVLAKKQLGAASGTAADSAPAVSTDAPATKPSGTPQQQVQQVQQAVEGAMQQARPMPTDDQ